MKAWKGNVTADSTLVNAAKARVGSQTQILTASQTQQIRGAFWGSILSLIGSVLSWIPIPGLQQIGWILTVISTAVAAIEGDFVTAIGNIVTLGFNSIVGAFKTAFDGVLKTLGPVGDMFRTMGQALNTVYSGVVGFFNSAIGFLPGIGPALQGAAAAAHTTIGAQIVNTALSTGLNIGVSRGLESLGVSPQISNFLGSLAAGAIIGGLKPETMAGGHVAVSQAQNIQASVQSAVVLNNVGRLGTELGLDPSFTNIIGLSLGAIQGHLITNPGSNLELAFSEIRPDLIGSLAQFGVQKLGISLGVDPRLSSLIGSPISAGIGTIFGQGVTTGTQIINSINDGLIRGATSLGIEYATQGVDPLLGSLTSRAITGAIEGVLGGNIFDGIFRAFSQSALNVARLGVSGTDSWSQTQYLQRVINFSDIVQQKGLAQAIEDSATQVLTEDSISSILKSFQTVGAFIQDQIQGNKPQTVQQDGTTYKKVLLANGDYQIYTADYKNLVEVKMGNTILRGTFGKDEAGHLGLKNGTVSVYDENERLQSKTYIENGWNIKDVHYSVDPLSGQDVVDLTVKPIKGKLGVTFDEFGNYRDADIENMKGDFNFSIKNGVVSSGQYGFRFMGDTDLTWMNQQGLDINNLNNFSMSQTLDDNGQFTTSLRWEANDSTVPENWIEALKSPEAAERILNAFQGFGFRTNAEISQHLNNNAEVLRTVAKSGTVISVRGKTPAAAMIKTISMGPINHTATLYEDNGGQKWVFEEKGPMFWQGLRIVKLDDWIAQYQSEGADINIGGLDEAGVNQDLKQAIERNFFYWNRDENGNWTMTNEVIEMPYNTFNLIGLTSGGNICSSLIVELYKDSGHPLFELTETDAQHQYSPNDVYRRLKLLGYTD